MEIIRPDGKKEVITTITEDGNNATLFRHFKGKIYKIITIAKDAETLQDMVVYEGQYENNPCWVRETEIFFSLVDSKKYRDITQKYRYEIINEQEEA